MLILLSLLATAAPPALELRAAPIEVPAVVEIPPNSLYWVNLKYPGGPTEAVAEILGDNLVHCDNLRGMLGFQPALGDALWERGLLRYATIELTSTALYVGDEKVLTLEQGRVPESHKQGVVIRPLLDQLLAQQEAQVQFSAACDHPEWRPGAGSTSGANGRVLVAVAPDMPFDVVHEVLVTARKARFKYFYFHAEGERVLQDPLAPPPMLGEIGARVFVASDGGLGIDATEEGTDGPRELLTYLPLPKTTRSARVVPYPASPVARVIAAAGTLLAKGWHPTVLPRLDADDLRQARVAPRAEDQSIELPSRRPITAVVLTLPEGSARETVADSRRTRFSITGTTPHVAVFTPPAHLADALNTPEVGAQLKAVLTCYRDESEDQESLSGDLVIEVRVKPSGEAARGTYLPTSTISDPLLRSCVLDEFLSLTLPAAAITPDPMLWRVQFYPTAPVSRSNAP